jgi:hypothetical protein
MREPDSLDALLREEWKSPEPTALMDQRVISAWRSAVRASAWLRFWRLRFSVPAPVLVAAMLAVFALFLWSRTAPEWLRGGPAIPVPIETPGAVTRLNATGFQPLPNGDARVIPAVEAK